MANLGQHPVGADAPPDLIRGARPDRRRGQLGGTEVLAGLLVGGDQAKDFFSQQGITLRRLSQETRSAGRLFFQRGLEQLLDALPPLRRHCSPRGEDDGRAIRMPARFLGPARIPPPLAASR